MKLPILILLAGTMGVAHAVPVSMAKSERTRTVVADTERGPIVNIALAEDTEDGSQPLLNDDDDDESNLTQVDEQQDQYDYEGWIWNLMAQDPELFMETVSNDSNAKVVIEVSKSSQRGKIIVNGKTVESFKLSTGLKWGDTPSGNFKPGARKVNWLSNFASRKYGRAIYLKHAVQIKGGSFMHAASTGAMNWLGKRRSSGCVRVPPRIAAKVYGLVNANPGRTVFRVN